MRNIIITAWTGVQPQNIDSLPMFKIVLVSLACNLTCLALSVITNNVDSIMTIVGDTVNVFMCFMLPPIF